jgi:ankyrin repeat protein
MNAQIKNILVDGLILFTVSTALVVLSDKGFSKLKDKTPKDDPIVSAITQGDLKKLEVVAKQGGKVAALTDEQGRTALMRAAYANLSGSKLLAETDTKRSEMIPVLLDHKAPLNQQDQDGWTALMWASWSGLPKVVEKMLDSGALHTMADKQGNTALILAAQRGNTEIVRQLMAKGADPAAKTRSGQIARDLARTGMREYPDKATAYQEIISLLESR